MAFEKIYVSTLAPIGGKNNQCHSGDLRGFFRGAQYMYRLSGRGKKTSSATAQWYWLVRRPCVSTYLYVISVISSNQIKICKWMSLKLCCGWHKTFDMSIIIFLLDIFKRTRKEVPPKANGLMMETPRFRFLFHNSFFVFMNKFVLKYMIILTC